MLRDKCIKPADGIKREKERENERERENEGKREKERERERERDVLRCMVRISTLAFRQVKRFLSLALSPTDLGFVFHRPI